MNPFALMKKDHKKAKDLFRKIMKSRDEQSRELLFQELKSELDAHAYMEESAFYPALKSIKSTHGIILESYEEHRLVKMLLKELEETPKAQDEWLAKMAVLRENVEHHIQEEEESVFPKAKKIMGRDTAEIAEEMQKAKESYLSGP